jgi:hypothetical protein
MMNMTRTKGFWAILAAICLTAVGFSGYSIYTRLTIHLANDTMEIRPKPVPPLPDAEEHEEPAAAASEAVQPPVKTPAAAKAEPRKQRAVKTRFEYKSASAKRVSLAGSFTKWKETSMAKKNGVWRADVYILPGNYLYHFVVDGEKTPEPGKAKSPLGESIAIVADSGAGEN